MKEGRCLGLVGELWVGATIHYYRELAREHQVQDRTLNIVITHAGSEEAAYIHQTYMKLAQAGQGTQEQF